MSNNLDNNSKPGPVTSAVNQALAGSAHDRRVELLGKVLGDYRLTAILGAGGVGTVYLGERADRAYSAQVAIKVVANSHLNQEVQRRFAAERQILANLNHPYIGRLLDAGETFFDEPFLVMEYVHGEAMDRYCNNQRLSVVERIQLFLQVCEAVQYAHRNLIVHRDLKPGNILVSKEGTPKLLDFGIAKLLDESAQVVLQEGIIAHTRVHDRLLTPEYASPEQIRGLPVTTASDVYSLGVILYELLTGVRPYAVNAQNQLELERSICIQDPLKPSHMAAALSRDSSTPHPLIKDASLIPIARKTTFPKLISQLNGDLDAIVMKALRKEPEHRYSSVEHLMDDLHRHLTQEPVHARQGNRWYYTQRFIKRHTLGVISATTALAALITVAIILSIQAKQLKEQRDIATQQRDKATQESKRAETVSNFMLDVFTAADPFQSQDKQVTAKELLDKAANKIETSLNDQPEVKARLLEAIGLTYYHQEMNDSAKGYLTQALQLELKLQTQNPVRLSRIFCTLGSIEVDAGAYKLGADELRSGIDRLKIAGMEKTSEYLDLIEITSLLQQKLGHLKDAQSSFENGLNLARQLYGEHHVKTATMYHHLSQLLVWQGNYAKAEIFAKNAVKIYEDALPNRDPFRVYAEVNLGLILYYLEKYDDSKKILTRALNDETTIFESDGMSRAVTYGYLSNVQLQLNELDEAEKSARTSLKLNKSHLNINRYELSVSHTILANVLLKQKRYSSAENEARVALNMLQVPSQEQTLHTASAQYVLANVLFSEYRTKEAEILLRENIDLLVQLGAPKWRIARSRSLLGATLIDLHMVTEAIKLLKLATEDLSVEGSGAPAADVLAAKQRLEHAQKLMSTKQLRIAKSTGRDNMARAGE